MSSFFILKNKMELERTNKVLEDFGNDFVELVLQVIEDKDGIASGEMYDTLGWRIEETEEGLTLFLTHTDYFPYWNDGTEPHWPPQAPIVKWVEDKGIEGRPMRVVRQWKWTTKDGVEHHNGKEVTILPTVQQIAFLVRRKISIEGTEPRGAFEYAYEHLIGIYEPLILEAFAEDTLENEGVIAALNNCLKNIM